MSENGESRVVDLTPGGKPVTHGKPVTYNYGCRCEECKASNTARQLKQRTARYSEGLQPGDKRHGTSNGYTNYGCRCRPCTDAATLQSAKYQKPYQWKKDKYRDLFARGHEVRHGTQWAYLYCGCRCEECKKDNREKSRNYREKKKAENNVRQQDSSNRSR